MPGDGPFLFLRDQGPPAGFWHTPPGGMCVSAFLFVRRGKKLLLGKYRDDPRWEQLAGLDRDRRRNYGHGWTIPARQLKFGEDPRHTARAVGEDILRIRGLRFSEPRVEVDLYEPRWLPGKQHYDMWFLVDAVAPKGWTLQVPPWYAELVWLDPAQLRDEDYARGHQDVVARWREPFRRSR